MPEKQKHESPKQGDMHCPPEFTLPQCPDLEEDIQKKDFQQDKDLQTKNGRNNALNGGENPAREGHSRSFRTHFVSEPV